MTDVHPTIPAIDSTSAAPSNPADAGKDIATDDWDTGPPRRKVGDAMARPTVALTGLSPAEMIECYVRMLNQLIEKTHPLTIEYLTLAQEVAPDNPGRDRLVNTGCKLGKSVQQMIATAARLIEDS